MSSLRGRALATVAIAAGLAMITVSTAEARGGYRGGYRGGHHHHGGWSTGAYVGLGLGVAALGGLAYLAATRPSYSYGPSYYSPYYYPPAYAPAPAYYAPPPYYYAPTYYAPAPAPVAYPYPPTPAYPAQAYPAPVSYYYQGNQQTEAPPPVSGYDNRAVGPAPAPGPNGNVPYMSTAYGTVLNPPSPYQTAAVPTR
jgi:hypothetical protein